MNTDNPPTSLNASHPGAEADDADPPLIDSLASKSELESKAEKETEGLAVGNKKDADANREEVEAPPFIDLLASKSNKESKTEKKTTGLALAPAIDPHDSATKEVRSPNILARHRKNRRERHAHADEEKTEIVAPATKNYRATRLDEEEEPQEELEDDYDSYVFPEVVRMGGNVDDDAVDAPNQAESLQAASSSAALVLQAELVPDVNEELAHLVLEDRGRWLRERNQNAMLATAVEVNDVDAKRWKLKILLFVLFVIGTVTALFILLRSPQTISRFSIMRGVIASSFEDDFPNSLLQLSVLNWLVDEDPASLAVDTDSTTLLERYTAALFYFATQGDFWLNQTGWLSESPVCLWRGLDCTDQGLLARMDLEKNNVVGQIPSELTLLTHLEDLRLYSNALTGPIPSELGLLTELTFLTLQINYLTGSVPSELHQLTNANIYLDGNNFTNCADFEPKHASYVSC